MLRFGAGTGRVDDHGGVAVQFIGQKWLAKEIAHFGSGAPEASTGRAPASVQSFNKLLVTLESLNFTASSKRQRKCAATCKQIGNQGLTLAQCVLDGRQEGHFPMGGCLKKRTRWRNDTGGTKALNRRLTSHDGLIAVGQTRQAVLSG